MFKVLFWLVWDLFFGYAVLSWADEMGGYIILVLLIMAFFTYELVKALKELPDK